MQVFQLGAGLDAELGDQGRPSSAVHLERLGLTAGVVEGVHQASDQPLTQRMRCDERVQLSDDGVCIAGRELLVDSPFERTEAKLLEAARLLGEHSRLGDICESGSPPELESFRRAPLAEQGFETKRVDRCAGGIQHVAVPPTLDGVLTERLAQPRDVGLHHLGGREGRILRPQSVDDRVDPDDRSTAHGE